MKKIIKKILPYRLYIFISWMLHPNNHIKQYKREKEFLRKIERQRNGYATALNKIQKKKPVKCVFFALYDSIWKCDPVYRRMSNDPNFDPIILICPIINKGRQHMLQEMRKCYSFFKKKDYNVICAYDEKKDKYLDVNDIIKPDIIVYTNPYKGLIDDRYFIDKFEDVLTVYIPYYINGTTNDNLAYNQVLHNLVWRYYVESPLHLSMAIEHSRNKGKNVVVAGYPGIEDFLRYNLSTIHYSKWQNGKSKKIIWAPHQTIHPVGNVNYSCFMLYYDFMLCMAKKYAESIQLIFKPHPLLKENLYAEWGKEKTDAYYHQWENMENTNVEYGDYHELFITSDAMIHDCGSFTIEYLYLNKPVMRTLNDTPLNEMFGPFGIKCIDNHYIGKSEKEIELFIQNVVNDIDPMKEQRTKFINETLMSEKKLPSENIVNDIIDSIENQRL